MRRTFAATMVAALCALAGPALASGLQGDKVDVSYTAPIKGATPLDLGATVVDPIAVFSPASNLTAILSGNLLTASFSGAGFPPTDLGRLDFKDLTSSNITGFKLLSTTGLTGLDQSDLGFTPSSLSLNLQDVSKVNGAGWSASLTAQVLTRDFVSSAPEPGAWALLTAGVGLAGMMLRRRRAEAKAGHGSFAL